MATKKKATKKRSTEIPLDAIPPKERTKLAYTEELKREAVRRVQAGETQRDVAKAMGITNSSVIGKWQDLIKAGLPLRGGSATSGTKKPAAALDVAAHLRGLLAAATKARDDRLDAAAAIVEADGMGKDAKDLAKRIRAMKHTP